MVENTNIDPAGARRSDTNRPVALIVDHDDLARRVACEIVGAAGFDIAPVACCDSAVAHLSKTHVDVLLIADALPEMRGHELAEIVAKDFPRMRCVLLLNPGTESESAAALRKPFTVEDFQRVLESFESEDVLEIVAT